MAPKFAPRLLLTVTLFALLSGCTIPARHGIESAEPATPATLAPAASAPLLADAAAVATAPAPVQVDTVCFQVRNQPGELDLPLGMVYWVWAQRFTTAQSGSTGIVLVAGGGADASQWDWAPDFSVARNLARGGVVFAFDGLGKAHSRPADVGFGFVDIHHVAILAQIERQVRDGSYSLGEGESCTGARPAEAPALDRVVAVGESLGSYQAINARERFGAFDGIVTGDVAHTGLNPLWNVYIGRATTTLDTNGYATFPLPDVCRLMMLYEAGAHDFGDDPCSRVPDHNAAFGEVVDLGAALGAELPLMTQIPAGFPVLLTFGDHSDAFRAQDGGPEREPQLWATFCPGCEVDTLTLNDTGHVLMLHESMPTWTAAILAWLAGHVAPSV